MKLMHVYFLFFVFIILSSCEKSDDNKTSFKVTDYDGNIYKTIKIGSQIWMAEDLKVTHEADGTPIPIILEDNIWASLQDNPFDIGCCFYENTEDDERAQGMLYTYAAAINACPEGWHLPTDNEWKELEIYLGMTEESANRSDWRGTNQGHILKSDFGWASFGNGTDSIGFAAFPGGSRAEDTGSFYSKGFNGKWWTATMYSDFQAYCRMLDYRNSKIGRYYGPMSLGYSVRYIKNQ